MYCVSRMNNTDNTNKVKRGRGRPRKDSVNKTENTDINIGVPTLLEPNIHDIHDELVRMDSFSYSRYNE